jgi:hypothetical protein
LALMRLYGLSGPTHLDQQRTLEAIDLRVTGHQPQQPLVNLQRCIVLAALLTQLGFEETGVHEFE